MNLQRREFLTLASSIGLAASSIPIVGTVIGPKARAEPKYGGTLRIQMTVREGKDPRTYDWQELGNLSCGWLEYLVRYRRDGVIEPQLLENWQISSDARTYILNIRRGVTWSNGDEFTAKDVSFNLERWCDKGTTGNSMWGRMSALVDDDTGKVRGGGIEIVDRHTVKLSLSKPDVTLMASMTEYPAAIVHRSFSENAPFENSIGTGPYRLKEHKPGEIAVLERNSGHSWWNEGNGAYLDRIEFIDYGNDPAKALIGLEIDEVDMVYETPLDFVRKIDNPALTMSEALTSSTIVIRANQDAQIRGRKPYADKRVRQALQFACDNALITETSISGLGLPAENHHVCPVHPDYAPLPPVAYDRQKALNLLQSADMVDFEHELISIDDDWRRKTCDAVASELRGAGIKVKRKILPGSEFWNGWAKYPFSSTNWNMRPLGVQIYSLAYRSGVPWNESAFKNSDFDSLLDKALGTADAKMRRALMAQMQKLIQEEAAIVQPYWLTRYRHAKANVANAEIHPMNELHIDQIWISS